MLYEIRTYWAAPGKIATLHNRFRSVTLGIFKKYDMEVIGFWTPAPVSPESGDLVYILRFKDEAAKSAAWDHFVNDPAWIAGKAASEVDGKLVDKLTSHLLAPTDYSPLT
jgi:hypothetical protein